MNDFIRYLLQSGGSLAILYVFYRMLLKNETYFGLNRILLLSIMPASMVLPFIHLPSPFTTSQIIPFENVAVPTTVSAQAIDIWMVLSIVYAAGIAVLLGRFVWSLSKLAAMVRKYGIIRQGNIGYVYTDQDCDFTFFNLIFINRESLTDQAYRHIVAHEKVHVVQGHTFDLILSELFTIFHWFNPIVWLYKGSIKETHEYIADEAVIAQGCEPIGYQMIILERFVGARIFDLASNFHESQIKRRITMMKRHQSKKLAWLKPVLLLPLLALLVLAFAKPRIVSTVSDGAGFVLSPVAYQTILPEQDTVKMDAESKKKVEELKKLQAKLKEKYMKLNEMVESGDEDVNADKLKDEMKKIKEKHGQVQVEIDKLTGKPTDKEAQYKKQKEIEEQKKKAEAEKKLKKEKKSTI